MFTGIFQSTTIPVLEQMVNFAEARHTVLAGNLANLHTPGYQARDLSVAEFQSRLKEAIEARDEAPSAKSPGDVATNFSSMIGQATDNPQGILYHDQSNDSAEFQVTEMVKNQLQHNMALSILTSQMRLLEAAVSERA
jgi:flagellar basal-body rod protein FlgB